MRRINIVAWNNGGGLSRDIEILCNALPEPHFEVTLNGLPLDQSVMRRQRFVHRLTNLARLWRHGRQFAASPFDVNLFLEDISPGFCRFARVNAFIPNPEWFKDYQRRYLKKIDVVLCKTKDAEETFRTLGGKTHFIGFSSEDRSNRKNPSAQKDGFLHLAGKSWQKGTQPLIDLWQKHPEWPPLTVVQSAKTYSQSRVKAVQAPNIKHLLERLSDADLRELQNNHGIHLCPSEAEGFGHCIAEAMSCSALTLTTDAPPMNELITPERGILVRYNKTRKQRSGTNYYVDPTDLEKKIGDILSMDPTSRQRLGAMARSWYEKNDERFRARLKESL
jgi:glycosyltransferase involved in cell wall biosynthesis